MNYVYSDKVVTFSFDNDGYTIFLDNSPFIFQPVSLFKYPQLTSEQNAKYHVMELCNALPPNYEEEISNLSPLTDEERDELFSSVLSKVNELMVLLKGVS